MRDIPPEPTAGATSYPGALQIWLSPSFPVGGFAFSQGLETAVERGWISDTPTLLGWLDTLLQHGTTRNDLILMAHIMAAETSADTRTLADLAAAMQPSAERALEAINQGMSFSQAYRDAWSPNPPGKSILDQIDNPTLTAAVAMAAAEHRFEVSATLEAFAIAHITSLLSAAIRLGVIGQIDGQRLMSRLLPVIREVVAKAETAPLADLGSATYGADLASMLHETQPTRLFRS